MKCINIFKLNYVKANINKYVNGHILLTNLPIKLIINDTFLYSELEGPQLN